MTLFPIFGAFLVGMLAVIVFLVCTDPRDASEPQAGPPFV